MAQGRWLGLVRLRTSCAKLSFHPNTLALQEIVPLQVWGLYCFPSRHTPCSYIVSSHQTLAKALRQWLFQSNAQRGCRLSNILSWYWHCHAHSSVCKEHDFSMCQACKTEALLSCRMHRFSQGLQHCKCKSDTAFCLQLPGPSKLWNALLLCKCAL